MSTITGSVAINAKPAALEGSDILYRFRPNENFHAIDSDYVSGGLYTVKKGDTRLAEKVVLWASVGLVTIQES